MSRGNASANTTASLANHLRPIVFIEFQFDSGTLRLHNGIGTYTWNSQEWTGAGELGEIGPIEDSDQNSPYRVWFRLNGLNDDLLAEARAQEIFERLVIVYLGYLDDAGNLVADPDERWRGYMDTMPISRGQVNAITLNAETELVRDFRANGSLFTDEDQQARYSGDIGFEFLDQMIDAQVQWGPGGESVRFGSYPGFNPGRVLNEWDRSRRSR